MVLPGMPIAKDSLVPSGTNGAFPSPIALRNLDGVDPSQLTSITTRKMDSFFMHARLHRLAKVCNVVVSGTAAFAAPIQAAVVPSTV